MRNLGLALLEGRIYEPEVWIVLRFGVHPGPDEALNGDLHGLHVDTARQPKVLIHGVAVSVLLRGPLPRPLGPGRARRARLVPNAVEGIQHGHVGRQCLLRDHVTHETDEVVVGDVGGTLTELADLVLEVGVLDVGRRLGSEGEAVRRWGGETARWSLTG